MLDQIEIVLSHTTHPGNIGAAARAMKVMGLSNLVLVNPKYYPSAEATDRASKANDILETAKVYSSMRQAISGSRLIVGTSARARSLPSKLVTPRELVEIINRDLTRAPISVLFGVENSGLTNEELHLCHYHVYIPTNPDYSSLNLASAVQLIAYEMRLAFSEMASLPVTEPSRNERAISRQELEGVLQHFDQIMQETGYLQEDNKKQLDIRMNRLLNKAALTLSETNILRGFLSSITQYGKRLNSKVLDKAEKQEGE